MNSDATSSVADSESSDPLAEALKQELEHWHLCYEAWAAERQAKRRPPPLHRRLALQTRRQQLHGDVILSRIWRCLRSFQPPPAPHQVRFHRSMLMSVIPLIYGDEWERYANHIKQALRMQEGEIIKQQVVISTPRRYGKTFSVSMFVAAMLYCLEGVEIAVFSPFGRQSSMLTELVWKFFLQLPGAAARKVKKNTEMIIVSEDGKENNPKRNTLYSMKSNAVGNRGITAQIVILEEAAFMPEDMFFDIILPLIGVQHTAVIGISTPPKTHLNYYLYLFQAKDDVGEEVFNTLTLQEICNECARKQKKECTHVDLERPKWKPRSRLRITAALTKHNPSVYRREVLGYAESEHLPAFHPMHLHGFFHLWPLITFAFTPTFVFTFIDPAEGGHTSDTAWVSVAYHHQKETAVVVGWGSVSTVDGSGLEEARALLSYVDALKADAVLGQSQFVYAVEANSSITHADNLVTTLRRRDYLACFMQECKNHVDGNYVWTGPRGPHTYQRHSNFLFQDERVRLAGKTYVMQDGEGPDRIHPQEERTYVEDLERQLSAYSLRVREPVDQATGEIRGKWSGKGSNAKDDLAVAFMGVLWWSGVFLSEKRYMNQFNLDPVPMYGAEGGMQGFY